MSTALYTPEILALATALAGYPLGDDLPLRGSARSRACGSTLSLGLALDAEGRIARVGLAAQACAIGQAAAAIFANGAKGRNARQITEAAAELAAWLSGEESLPDWPGIATLAPARAYPARRGAIQLAWAAACEALSSDAAAR